MKNNANNAVLSASATAAAHLTTHWFSDELSITIHSIRMNRLGFEGILSVSVLQLGLPIFAIISFTFLQIALSRPWCFTFNLGAFKPQWLSHSRFFFAAVVNIMATNCGGHNGEKKRRNKVANRMKWFVEYEKQNEVCNFSYRKQASAFAWKLGLHSPASLIAVHPVYTCMYNVIDKVTMVE